MIKKNQALLSLAQSVGHVETTRDRLLAAAEPAPFELATPEGKRPVLLVCDHASRLVPRGLENLGLPEDELKRHIGWDIGIAGITREVSRRLDCPAVLAGYSRLVIDLNRQPGEPGSIPEVSDETPVPGNQNLPEAARVARQDALFHPYHGAITAAIAHLWQKHGTPPALVSMHSFTPVMKGVNRPWHIGVLWHHDGRLAQSFFKYMAESHPEMNVGDNEPYAGAEVGYTLDRHAGSGGLAHIGFEIRQDLIGDAEGEAQWADIMTGALESILNNPALYEVVHY